MDEDYTDTEITYTSTEIGGIGNIYIDPQVLTITKEMLELRGYTIEQEPHSSDNNHLVASKKGDIVTCLFVTEKNGDSKLNVAKMKSILTTIFETDGTHFIIIHSEPKLSSRVISIINNFKTINDSYKIETFHNNVLRYNITKHKYVPPIEQLSKEDGTEIKTRYRKCLQYFLSSDPLIRFYGIEKGSIVKVYRKDGIVIYKIVL